MIDGLVSGRLYGTAQSLIDELCRIEEARDAVLFGQMARLVGDAEASKFW